MGKYLRRAPPSVQIDMGNPIPSWLLSAFFRLGLNPDLEPYTFQTVNTAQTQKWELEIDEMIIALVDHDRRQQFSEDIRAHGR